MELHRGGVVAWGRFVLSSTIGRLGVGFEVVACVGQTVGGVGCCGAGLCGCGLIPHLVYLRFCLCVRATRK
ncbi:Uncharacterised protein [Dermatophilus congolensis]|uniref:Uncharacterized protein n=1 Tax=Dermatophilus congolensis TaxID=1863 RepID=A0A239VTR8_9MICO|nr:Uncharacterised protein [Dermatophilus congolensis]